MQGKKVAFMLEILWHGRGGQGAFTAARLLGAAFIQTESGFALAFPSFGPERRGAPIRAFTKLDKKPITNRSEIEKADFVIYLDDTLFPGEAAFAELKPNGKILLNTKETWEDEQIITIDGDCLATEILGRPITNTVMLGVISTLAPEITLDHLTAAIASYMPPKLQGKNIALIKAAAETISKEAHQ